MYSFKEPAVASSHQHMLNIQVAKNVSTTIACAPQNVNAVISTLLHRSYLIARGTLSHRYTEHKIGALQQRFSYKYWG